MPNLARNMNWIRFEVDLRFAGRLLIVIVLVGGTSVNGFSASSNVHTLLLCRHGDSIWNGGQPGLPERFTGWTEVPLSEKGKLEAIDAAKQLTTYLEPIDVIFTSAQERAHATTDECLKSLAAMGQHPPVIYDWRLNERHYGALQGYIKQEVQEGKYGHDRESVTQWRRSWHVPPPMLEDEDPRRVRELKQYETMCGGANNVPRGESLEMVAKIRVRPFLERVLTPILDAAAVSKANSLEQPPTTTGLIVAHANSLRALIGVLCEVEDDPAALKVLEALHIPTGVPLMIHFQQLSTGRFRACPLPDTTECLVHEPNGWIHHPRKAPTNLGHPDLPVWPLNTCIPLEHLIRRDARILQDEMILTA